VRVEVHSKVPGGGAPPPSAFLEFERETVTARVLIARAVEAEVAPAVLADGADARAEVGRALLAFERGRFALLCGGRQVTCLDDEVILRLGEPVLFLKLVPLVGG
jgi:hypothetical protein